MHANSRQEIDTVYQVMSLLPLVWVILQLVTHWQMKKPKSSWVNQRSRTLSNWWLSQNLQTKTRWARPSKIGWRRSNIPRLTLKLVKQLSLKGELHLTSLLTCREFKVEVTVLLKYLTVKHSALLLKHGFFKRQSGGKGQFGDVWIEFTPNEEGKGFEFENAIVGGVVPRIYPSGWKRFGRIYG